MAKKMKLTALIATAITVFCIAVYIFTKNGTALTLAITFGALAVFILTSVLAACYDAMFVVMQRYNRPRIVKLVEKKK